MGLITRWVAMVTAVPVVPLFHLANRTRLTGTLRLVSRIGSVRLLPSLSPDELARGIGRASRLWGLHRSTCLAQSELVWISCRWAGHQPQLVVGAPEGLGRSGFAHAWVEVDGRPLGQSEARLSNLHRFDSPLLPDPT